jgi:hypothetical protein
MVQFIKGSADPREASYGALAQALGQGLGHGVTSHFANEALEGVLNDEKYKNASQSEKMGALQKALSPYGAPGRELLQNRLQTEHVAYQEKQEKKQNEQAQIMGKILNKKPVSEKERSLLSPEQSLAIAKHEQALEIEQLKVNNKAPLGGLGGQTVPPQIADAIENIMKENPDASSDELGVKFSKAGVPTHYQNPYLENRRRSKELASKEKTAEEKLATKQDIDFHEASKGYDETIQKEAKVAKKQLDSIEDIEKSVKEGKIKPTNAANVLKFFGPIGERLAEAALTKDQAKLQAAIPEFLEGRKELFGVRLSDADLKLLQDKLPDIAKSPEANLAILGLMKKYANQSLLKKKAAENVLESKGIAVKNREGKLRPLNYESLVENEYDRLVIDTTPIRVQAPDKTLWEMTPEQIRKAKEQGVEFTKPRL